MAQAIRPKEVPPLPEGTVAWARSTRRRGGMYHAHVIGVTACRSVYLDRFHSEEARGIGDLQYWGVCPRCYAKALRTAAGRL